MSLLRNTADGHATQSSRVVGFTGAAEEERP